MSTTSFRDQVNTLSEQQVELCFGCHKCTSGCPVASDMTYGPDRVLRMVQLGDSTRLLESHDIWLCASCETCGTRCPNEIDIARVMDALRALAISSDVRIGEPRAMKFHRLFLDVVRLLGRSHEASLLVSYKLWTMDLMSDMDSGARLIFKGKVPLIPHPYPSRKQVQALFQAARQLEQAEAKGDPQP